MKYSEIYFDKKESGFKHNLDADYACFALWKDARSYRDRIRNLLVSEFEVLLETEIEWSEKWFHENASRLYEAPILKANSRNQQRSSHADKIGDTKFVLFVVKDVNPNYTYAMSVSKKIELSNLNVVAAKYTIRDWICKDLNVKYAVHSTNNIYEFFFQAPLILGMDLFERLLRGEKPSIDRMSKDLEGAGGWNDYRDIFQILNLSSNYLVQRGFETLPESNAEKDIDLLTTNYQRVASALGAHQEPIKPYKGYILVNKEMVSVDMRYVGDNYYDTSWQKDMLRNKVNKKGVFIPREDDYFFSLLYHCKVQKGTIKEKYIPILERIAQKLNFEWYNTDVLRNNKQVGHILKGYFESQGYYYSRPADSAVFKNIDVIRYLPVNKQEVYRKPPVRRFKAFLKRTLPKEIVNVIKKTLKG